MTTTGQSCPPIPRRATWLLKFATVLLVFGLGSIAMAQETTPPTVSSVSPSDGETNVSRGITTIEVNFSEEMNGETYIDNIYLADSIGDNVAMSSVGSGSTFYQLHLLSTLEPNETYTVHVTTDVQDLNGNAIAESFTSSFTTEDFSNDNDPVGGSGDDNDPLEINCPPDTSISCEDSPETVAELAAAVGGCPGTIDITHVDGWGGPVVCDMFLRMWTATDSCGNTSSCSQVVTITDDQAPVITCPEDVAVSCEDDRTSGNTGVATATDNCDDGELDIAEIESFMAGSCPQEEVVTRIWTATDSCGNASNCGQIITVVDDQAPDITCPNDVTLSYDQSSDPGNTGYASVSDNCDNYPMVTWHDTADPYEMEDEYPTIFRSWTVTDECGNSTVCDQEISWPGDPYLSYWSPANGASEVHPETRLEFVVDPVPIAMQFVPGDEDPIDGGREGSDEEQVTYDLFVGQDTVTIEEFLDGLNNLHADHPEEIQFRANGNVVFQDGGPAILLFDMDQNNNVTVTGIEEELFDNGMTYNPTGEPAYGADQARKNFPILGVTWYGALYYCNWLTYLKDGDEDDEDGAYAIGPEPADWRPASLSKADWLDGFNDSEREAWIQQYPDAYRLPMDDYAVGASRHNEFFHFVGDFGEGVESGENDDRVNYWNSGDFFDNGPVPTDYSVASEFGLDNVLGNVWEWQTDTFDPQDLSARSLRGASWYSNQELIDPAKRIAADPGSGFADVGFRVVARNDAVWEVEIAENAEFTDSTVLTMPPGFADLNGHYPSRAWELSLAPSTDYFWRVRGSHADVGSPAEFIDLPFGAPWDSPTAYATFRTSHQVREPALQLNLAGEWNLVSVNVDPDHNVAHPKHLFGADSTAWGWDSEQQIYFRLYEIKPFEGFWIHVPEPGTVEVTGFTPEPEIEIRHGWNLLGPLNDGTALPSPSQLRGEVMQYFNGGYESADILDTGIGYWMFFIADFVHDLSGGDGDEEVE